MSDNCRNYISRFLPIEPPQNPDPFYPPKFHEAADWCLEARKTAKTPIPLGKVNDHQIHLVPSGKVQTATKDFSGFGCLTVVGRSGFEINRQVYVLGSLAGTSTAVLLDEGWDLWFLRQIGDAVDPALAELEKPLSLVWNGRSGLTAETSLEIVGYGAGHMEMANS
jgi:hypothetical protein